jgi:hypothetical protein
MPMLHMPIVDIAEGSRRSRGIDDSTDGPLFWLSSMFVLIDSSLELPARNVDLCLGRFDKHQFGSSKLRIAGMRTYIQQAEQYVFPVPRLNEENVHKSAGGQFVW